MIRPFIDATGTLRPTAMELYAAARALDAERPPEMGGRPCSTCTCETPAARPGTG
jgi:hypothetical protein